MGVYKRKIKHMLKHSPASDLFPVVEYWDEDELFIIEGPCVGAMFICQPTPGSSDEIRNTLDNLYRMKFPKNTTLQVSLVSLPDIEDSLYGYRAIRTNRMMNIDAEPCEAMADSIHDFFRNGTLNSINQEGYKFKDFELWFTLKVPIKKAIPSEKETSAFRTLSNSVYSRLSPFAPVRADEFALKRRMNVLLNMYDGKDWMGKAKHEDKSFSTDVLGAQFLDVGKRIESKKNGISIKNGDGSEVQFIKTLSVTKMPERMIYGQMINLLGDWRSGYDGLYEHFMVTLNIIVPDQNKAKSKLAKGRAFVGNQAKGSLIQHLDQLRFQKRDFDTINREVTQERSKLVKYSMQVIVFSRNEKDAEKFTNKIIGKYGERNIDLVSDSHFALPFLLGNLPFGLDEEYLKLSSRFNDATSKAMVFMTPHIASWKGNTTHPAFILGSRFGQAVNLDFFKSDTNFNIYCAATSGAGKSFFTGYLVNAMLGSGIKHHPDPNYIEHEFDDGAQVFIIDVGHSYVGLASQYEKSQFLEFDSNMKFSLNPFPSIDEFRGKDGMGPMVRSLIKTMAAPSGNISDYQNSEILEVLNQMWNEKGKKSTITEFSKRCRAHERHEMQMIGEQLKPFCEGGTYGDYFSDKYPPVSFKERLVVCELEALKSDPHLQVCVLMSVIMGIQHAMYLSGMDRRKMFILDEGWEYLKEDGSASANMLKFFAEFLETGWRRFRKYNASGALITQNVMDAYASAVGKAIVANSAWLLLMKQTPEAVKALENNDAYDGNETDFELIKSLRTVKSKPGLSDEAFSEVFVRFNDVKQVCRLYTDRRLQLILTTDADEKARRKVYLDKGLTLIEAVDAMLEEENRNKRATVTG